MHSARQHGEGKDGKQRRKEAHRALGQGSQPGGDEEEAKEPRPVLEPAADEEVHRQRDQAEQQHVDLPDPRLPEDPPGSGENGDRPPGDAAVEEPLRHAEKEEQRGDCGEK